MEDSLCPYLLTGCSTHLHKSPTKVTGSAVFTCKISTFLTPQRVLDLFLGVHFTSYGNPDFQQMAHQNLPFLLTKAESFIPQLTLAVPMTEDTTVPPIWWQ